MGLISWNNSCDGIYSSLDVRFTKACDNNCAFCIEKKGLTSLGKTQVQELIASTISSGIQDVLILGGEPLLFPEAVYEYVSNIRPYVDSIYLTTSLPNTFNTNEKLIRQIINLLDGLNVSIQHYNWKRNNEILDATSQHNRLAILRRLNLLYAYKIRTSINLVKGAIDDKAKLLRCLFFLQKQGCLHVKINELQSSDSFVSYEEIMGKKLPPAFSTGCQTQIRIKGLDMKLTLKRSCFKVAPVDASWRDVLKILLGYFRKQKNKFLVLYENGMIQNKWLEERND